MTHETKTTALVATTLGMATLAAAVAVFAATASHAESPKILDRLSDAAPGLVEPRLPQPKPELTEIRGTDGAVVYRHDPAAGETVLAKGFNLPVDGVPVPVARREALLGSAIAVAVPLSRPLPTTTLAAVALPPERPAWATDDVALPLPKPAPEIRLSSVSFDRRPAAE